MPEEVVLSSATGECTCPLPIPTVLSKLFSQASCLVSSKIKSVKNPLLTDDVGHFKVLFFQTSREARDGRPGFSKAVFKSNFSSLIYLQKGLVSLM